MTARFGARRPQRGVSLIELLVGLSIGLLVIGVALGAVLLSRQIAGTTSEAARLQRQAAHALRIIGSQVRQAGALELDLAFHQAKPTSGFLTIDPAEPVAFDNSLGRATAALDSSATYPLTAGQAFYRERLNSSRTQPAAQLRDCLGHTPSTGTRLLSAFVLRRDAGAPSGELRCLGSNGSVGAQALIGDVADFQVAWLRQRVVAGQPVIDRVNAATAAADWPAIHGVEVCIEMAGSEHVDTGSRTYRPCGWTAGGEERSRGNRLRLVYRNVFELRTQGALR